MENIFNCEASSKIALELFRSMSKENDNVGAKSDYLSIHRKCFNNSLRMRHELATFQQQVDKLREEIDGK